MAQRTIEQLQQQILTFQTGIPHNVTAEKLRNFLTDLVDSLGVAGSGLTQEQVEAIVDELGYQTAAQVRGLIATYNFITAALVEAYGYQTADQVDALLDTGRYLHYGDAYDARQAYSFSAVVRNGTANYLCIAPVAANTAALTEPGTGTHWREYWLLLGHRVNNPDAFTGVVPGDGSFTLMRAGGTNPVEVSLAPSAPAAAGPVRFAPAFSATVNAPANSDAGVRVGSGSEIIEDDANVTYLLLANSQASGSFTFVVTGEELRSITSRATAFGKVTPSFNGLSFWTNASGHLLLSAGLTGINNVSISVLKLTPGAGDGDTGRPSITSFVVEGPQHPPAGTDIGGRRYTYETQIAQAAHASIVRIVGYAGAVQANPSSVAVLASISEADFAHAQGSVQIPANTVLAAAGDAYNIRLEVYRTNQTPGTNEPVAHQDYRITAQAVSALVHFGAIRSTEGAADITFADDDIATGTEAAGTWTNTGIPETEDRYRNYLAVPASLAQPASYASAGLDASNSWADAVDRTIAGVAYKVYLVKALFAATGSELNGQSWTIS